MKYLRFIVRETPGVLGLRPGDTCWIGRESYRPDKGPESSVQVFRDDFRWMTDWSKLRYFLPSFKFLRTQQRAYRRDFVFLVNPRRLMERKPNPFLSNPKLTGDDKMGIVPWQFESVGEAVYFLKSRKLRARSFMICEAQGGKLNHLFE